MPGIDECWALPRLLAPHLLEGGGSADEDAEPAGGVRGDVADAPAELSAVQAFLQAHMDSRGLSRQQLQVCLLRHLTKPAQAAALPDAALPQLLTDGARAWQNLLGNLANGAAAPTSPSTR